MNRFKTLSLFFSAGVLGACAGTDPAYELSQFSSCDDLESTIKSQAIEEIRWANAWGGLGGLGFCGLWHCAAGAGGCLRCKRDFGDAAAQCEVFRGVQLVGLFCDSQDVGGRV